MRRQRPIVYWDTDAFLGLLNKEAGKCGPCEDVWVSAQRGNIFIMTSTLTIAEVIHRKGTPKMDPAMRPRITTFFRAPWLISRPLTRVVAELARDVVWDSNVLAKDAVHVATAAFHKVGALHTFDGELLKLGTINVEGFVIAVQEPSAPRQLELPGTE